MKNLTVLICVLAVSILTTETLATPKAAQLPEPQIAQHHISRAFIHELGKKTNLPIMLPQLEKISTDTDLAYHTYDIQLAKPNGYWVSFDYTSDCQGAPICSAGSLIVMKVDPESLTKYNVPLAITPQQIIQLNSNTGNKAVTAIAAKSTTEATTNNEPTGPTAIKNYLPIMLNNTTPGYISNYNPNAFNATSFKTLIWVKDAMYFQLTLKKIPLKIMLALANNLKVRV